MNTAAKVREAKEKNPENFCRNPRCLWRTVTRDGIKPCPKHQIVMVDAAGLELSYSAAGRNQLKRLERDGSDDLLDALKAEDPEFWNGL